MSFPTISGTGPNGAIIHYRPSTKTNRVLKNGDIYLVPVVSESVFSNIKKKVLPSHVYLKKVLSKIKKNKSDIIILLSHSGIDEDKEYTKSFPQIDWILESYLNGAR